MGRYQLGDIIRMTRKSLSITQEQLCEDICSVETLSRIENGSQNPSRDTYELLMERMGRFRERAYSVLSVSDLKVLEKMKLFEDYVKLYDFNNANNILKKIKEKLGNSTLDKQFLIRAQCLVDYYLNRIDKEEFLDGLQKAIRLTIPKYGTISLSNWPLNFNETLIIVNIAIAYSEKEEYQNAIDTIEEAYNALKHSYMEEELRAILLVAIANNISKWYGLIGKHEEAIAIAKEGIQYCKKYKLGNALPNLLYGVVWNKEQLINLGVLSPENKKECVYNLKKAYYIASSMELTFVEKFISDHIAEYYSDYISVITD